MTLLHVQSRLCFGATRLGEPVIFSAGCGAERGLKLRPAVPSVTFGAMRFAAGLVSKVFTLNAFPPDRLIKSDVGDVTAGAFHSEAVFLTGKVATRGKGAGTVLRGLARNLERGDRGDRGDRGAALLAEAAGGFPPRGDPRALGEAGGRCFGGVGFCCSSPVPCEEEAAVVLPLLPASLCGATWPGCSSWTSALDHLCNSWLLSSCTLTL